MRQIFVFTAGDKSARRHLKDSILQAVPFDWMETPLGNEQAAYFKSLVPDDDGFFAWGAVPGPVNARTWEAMQVGDLVLTVYDNQYQFISTVVGKFRNADLARRIWGSDGEGRTWEFMYQLSRPKAISVGVLSNPASIYLNQGYRGFVRISDAKVQAIHSSFGSLARFVEEVFRQTVPATHIERELGEERAAAAAAVYEPTNMVDSRRRVIQEIVRRQGQPQFRRTLLAAYRGTCVVTGCTTEEVLEAAHISPYLGVDSNAVQNGLLLRADVHMLFDLGLLKVTPKGIVELHEQLLGSIYEQYAGKAIRAPTSGELAPHPAALARKYWAIL